MVRVRASRRPNPAVKLAFISPLVSEISQLQSAQDRVVLARTNAIIVRSEHYELVAIGDPRAPKSARWTHKRCCANFKKIRLYDLHSTDAVSKKLRGENLKVWARPTYQQNLLSAVSALPPKADICNLDQNVRFWHKAAVSVMAGRLRKHP